MFQIMNTHIRTPHFFSGLSPRSAVHMIDWVLFLREDILRMAPTHFFDYRFGHPVQDNKSVLSIFHPVGGYDKD